MTEYVARRAATEEAMSAAGAEAMVLSVGPDLEYLTGYQGLELERLNLLVMVTGSDPVMIMPELEAPGFPAGDRNVEIVTWADGSDPLRILDERLGSVRRLAVADTMRAGLVVPIRDRRPETEIVLSSGIIGSLRAVKSPLEREKLRAAGSVADDVMRPVQSGDVPLMGRSERDIANEIRRRLVEAGHDTAEFVIVAAGENAASPHHHPTSRVVGTDEIVLFDFGGRRAGYSSDTTRCVYTGRVPGEIAEAYRVLSEAHRAGVNAARVGSTCQDVDRASRAVISEAGYGDRFLHRTGHGIGLEVHERPYIVEGNETEIVSGHAFSVEPGIYVAGAWGMRLEDIVIVTDDGALSCNESRRDLVELV